MFRLCHESVYLRGPRWSSSYTSRLSSRRTVDRFPEQAATHHSYCHCMYLSYLLSSIGWGRKMSVPISVSHFFPLCTMCEYNDLNSLYSIERSESSHKSSSPSMYVRVNIHKRCETSSAHVILGGNTVRNMPLQV